MNQAPELSIIIPVLNEGDALAHLFATLAGQQDVDMELVFSDGGSGDGSQALIHTLAAEFPWPVNVICGERGRGRQLNAGAAVSRGESLLFLHADSCFTDARALRTGLDALNAVSAGAEGVAGRFGLTFRRSSPAPSLAYHFYECKARLNRRECIHGDQGMLMGRGFFREVGPFDEALPVAEDTALAEAIHEKGRWLLFPATILTSARRFEIEGLRQRQTLNAIIMNLTAIGRSDFFRHLAGVYRSQDRTRPLDLHAMLTAVGRLIAGLPVRERLSLWYDTGTYVSSHAWQIPFFLDAWRGFRRRLPPGSQGTPLLSFHDRHFSRVFAWRIVRASTALLVWVWYRLTLLHAATGRAESRAPARRSRPPEC